MLRLTPCGGEDYDAGVICILVKLTKGDDPLVNGWSEILSADKSTMIDTMNENTISDTRKYSYKTGGNSPSPYSETYCRTIPSTDSSHWRNTCTRTLAFVDDVFPKLDGMIRQAIGKLRFEMADHALDICTCANGVAKTGTDCTGGIGAGEKCSSCNSGYYETSYGTCEEKICTCNNGIPKTGSDCPTNGQAKCAKCYVHLNSDLAFNGAETGDGYRWIMNSAGTACARSAWVGDD
jgi:hypothetical protein